MKSQLFEQTKRLKNGLKPDRRYFSKYGVAEVAEFLRSRTSGLGYHELEPSAAETRCVKELTHVYSVEAQTSSRWCGSSNATPGVIFVT
ncbi:hypothetical protein TNCV_3357401 [Trichonephila clavipes]|nr:hypothetical protein TNCV_3357401 [Trichonephila clavipes]